MIAPPQRVWLKTEKGWFSREARDYDREMWALIARSFEPGGKLTEEERELLDAYNESLRLEAGPLERDLRAKHGHTLPQRQQGYKKGLKPRSTRGNATFRMKFPDWMRRVLGV